MSETLGLPTAHVRLGSNAGQPLTRRDGIAKVTGAAAYAADNRPDSLLHAVYAVSSVGRGRVAFLDIEAAKGHPGVIEVITPANRPPLARDPDEKVHMFSWRVEALQDDHVRYAGQPIALVVAETLEAATEGARLLAPRYEAALARLGWRDGETYDPTGVGIGTPPTFEKGDVAAGHAAAAHSIECQIETPLQYHNALEPHAIVAQFDGDRLTIDIPHQAIAIGQSDFATFFGIPTENVHIRSPFIGGGFGSKAILAGPQLLAVLAARMLGRPVKLVLRRDQMFGPVGHRGATRQRLKLSTDAHGQLTALEHHTDGTTSSFDEFVEPAGLASQNTYASPAIATHHRGVRTDTGTPGPMRGPGKASGSAALECAMDEAAEACGLDPLEFRLRNYAQTDPASGKPFSSKALRQCYAEGAKRFGWAGRPLAPRQMRDDTGHLVGWGVGTAVFPSPMFKAEARAVLHDDGSATVETSGVEMGQGALTVLLQIAADGLGLDAGDVKLRTGSSDLPDGGVAGGSGHTATAGSALFAAGSDVIRQLADLATKDPASPLFGAGNEGVVARAGKLHRANDDARSERYADILARAGLANIEGRGTGVRNPADAEDYAMFTHGAVFAEVKVDPDLCQIRVSRLVGAFAAGRVINPRLTKSQLTGGMIWGLSFALHEEGLHDHRTGRPMNADLAGYHVPVNADCPHVEALLVEEEDRHVNALGVKGVGEIGITGSVGAIANALWHATGVRTRKFPIRMETLLR